MDYNYKPPFFFDILLIKFALYYERVRAFYEKLRIFYYIFPWPDVYQESLERVKADAYHEN